MVVVFHRAALEGIEDAGETVQALVDFQALCRVQKLRKPIMEDAVTDAIAKAQQKWSWRPVRLSPVAAKPLAETSTSASSGEISGNTPLSLRCQPLDPQRQGLQGIGRLASSCPPAASTVAHIS